MIWRFLSVLLAGCLACTAAHAGPTRESVEKQFLWRLALAADGSIQRLDALSPLPDDLRDKLEASIRAWNFRSGSINGKTVATESTLRLHVRAEPVEDGGWVFRLLGASTGPRLLEIAAYYPPAAAAARRSGMVIVLGELDREGRVVEATIADTSPVKSGVLAGAAIDAMKRARFETERLDGRGVRAMVLQPVCFTDPKLPSGRGKACRIKYAGTDAGDEQQTIALDSAVGLETDAVGKAL